MQTCPACGQAGLIYTPDWERLLEFLKERTARWNMARKARKPERRMVGPVATAGFMLAALCFALAGVGFVLREGLLFPVSLYSGFGLTALTLVAAVVGAIVGRGRGAPAEREQGR